MKYVLQQLFSKVQDYQWLGIASLIFTFGLAYVDEGRNNFDWMKDPGSWLSVLAYGSLVFLILYFSHKVLLSWYKGNAKLVLSIGLGFALSIAIILLFVVK